ncbi:MAG: DoxX family protein [Burkholderiales bacterium]
MNDKQLSAYGALLLRVALGLMFIAHSVYLKGMVYTLAGTAQFFESIGLPGPLAYVVFAMEAVGGVLLILGVRTRIVAAALVPILIGATWTHAGNGWLFTNPNGGWEYPLFLVIATLVQALLGNGALALSRDDKQGHSTPVSIASPPFAV